MTASHTLLTRGYLGSDMFAGFFNADRHWFANPPAQHFYHAGVFALAEPSIAAARFVSVIAAVALLITTTTLAWRWWGPLAALFACLSMALLPSGLTATTDVPLFGHARNARYDLAAASLLWLSVLVFHQLLTAPSRLKAVSLGVVAGLATLTHWFGIGAPIFVIVAWLWERRRGEVALASRPMSGLAIATTTGFAAIAVPYAVYAVAYANDAAGQVRALLGPRIGLTDLGALLSNILVEPRRYEALLEPRASGSWLFLAAIAPCVGYLVYRVRSRNRLGDRLLLVASAASLAVLAVFDVVKAPLYALALLPATSLVLALAWGDLVRFGRAFATWRQRTAITTAIAGAVVVVWLGAQSYDEQLRSARAIEPYAVTESRLLAAVDPTATTLGSIRWGWAFRDRSYASELASWYGWRIGSIAPQAPPESLRQALAARGISHVVVDSDLRESLAAYPQWLRDEFARLISDCTTVTDSWTTGPYGPIAVYRVDSLPC